MEESRRKRRGSLGGKKENRKILRSGEGIRGWGSGTTERKKLKEHIVIVLGYIERDREIIEDFRKSWG